MSLFTRALAGAGEQAVSITNKYIDESLAQQRLQAIADIGRQSAQQQREDADAFNNDPTRVTRNRANAVADTEALGAAKNKVELAGRVAESSDPTITAGLTERAGKVAGATETARVKAQGDEQTRLLSDPEYIKGLRAKAAAERDPNANVGQIAQAQLAKFQLGQAQKVATLQDELTKAIDAGDSKAETAAREKIGALSGKDGKTTEFYKVAEGASKAMAPALKVLADPMAPADAKSEAEQTLREQRALLTAAAKRAGVDLADAAKEPQDSVHAKAKAAIAAGASADAVNKKLTESGYAALPAAEKKKGLFDQAQPKPRTSGQMNLDAAAEKAGYKMSVGNDGRDYYSRSVDGQGENLTAKQLSERLGLIF